MQGHLSLAGWGWLPCRMPRIELLPTLTALQSHLLYGGAFIGFIYGFVLGYALGRLIGYVYNLIAATQRRS